LYKSTAASKEADPYAGVGVGSCRSMCCLCVAPEEAENRFVVVVFRSRVADARAIVASQAIVWRMGRYAMKKMTAESIDSVVGAMVVVVVVVDIALDNDLLIVVVVVVVDVVVVVVVHPYCLNMEKQDRSVDEHVYEFVS
jgi:hypothetical protein